MVTESQKTFIRNTARALESAKAEIARLEGVVAELEKLLDKNLVQTALADRTGIEGLGAGQDVTNFKMKPQPRTAKENDDIVAAMDDRTRVEFEL